MNPNPYAKMKRIIFLIMILVPAVPFFLTLGIGYHYFTSSIESSTLATMTRIMVDHRRMIDSFLAERRADLEFILNTQKFEELSDSQKLYDISLQLQKQSSAFVDLGLFSEEGIHLVYYGPYRLTGRDYGKEEWFLQVMKDGSYISDIFLGFRRVPHFVIALKKTDPERSWILRATIDTYIFNDVVKSVRIGKTGEAYIVNSEGYLQTDRRSGGNLMDTDSEYIDHPASDSGTKITIKKDGSGEEYLYATTWLTNKPWLLVVRQQKADAFKALRSASYAILLIIVLGGCLIVGVAFYLTEWIVRRMEKMERDREQLSGQLIRATRLAELGEMAAGFAHEINNPLQIMKSEQTLIETIFSDLKQKGELKESEDLKDVEDSMSQIKLQIDRCAKITQAILRFGRQSDSAPKDIDLSIFIPEVLGMIEKKAAVTGIALRRDILPHTPLVHVDASQLQQVLINLLNNAIDAIVDRHGSEGGELSVQARPATNGRVMIAVTDNGIGISPENLKRVFAPFFTTKPVGKGTGLGLSVCYGIIDGMGGTMEVTSQKGVGTTFTIRLPVAGT
ncbi:MAG: two-component sensor histidine kinase [Deltaproteobacteria bacterium HGW-Deltaproteobacteria-21]|nr:MAG: two-component sensor histidine kinase [Deltaproteobacteria bacterium HGW-Deltaproteobacteria-21]